MQVKTWLVTLLVLFKFLNCRCQEQLPVDCGRVRASNRIVGGKNAYLGQFPSIARIGYGRNQLVCGGVIITKRHILTAAHCLDEDEKFVRLGDNFGGRPDCESGVCAPLAQDINIVSKKIHPSFNPDTIVNDIALINLAKDINFNEFVQPACLPQEPKFKKKLTGVVQVAGWGYTSWKYRSVPRKLKFAALDLVNHLECRKLFNVKPSVVRTQYCAVDSDGKGQDSCNGDSGGPMYKTFTQHGKSKQYVFGIVSYGLTKCGEGPAIYTNIAHYMEWVKKNL